MVLGILGPLNAQVKIGYANINAILALMPETQEMNKQLQELEPKVYEKVQIKQNYAQTKYQEYLELSEDPNANQEQLKALEAELQRLQGEIQQEQSKAQQQMAIKQQELMEPITEKIQASIKKIAEAGGYTYILNTVDGSGASIILHAPEEHNLTEKILNDLGVEIPEELKTSSN